MRAIRYSKREWEKDYATIGNKFRLFGWRLPPVFYLTFTKLPNGELWFRKIEPDYPISSALRELLILLAQHQHGSLPLQEIEKTFNPKYNKIIWQEVWPMILNRGKKEKANGEIIAKYRFTIHNDIVDDDDESYLTFTKKEY